MIQSPEVDDGLGAARGAMNGLILSIPIWVILIGLGYWVWRLI